jgi:hypothetical protein
MTLTLDRLPDVVTAALQQKAEAEGRSVQEVAAEALARGLGVAAGRDLRDVAGTMTEADARAVEETVRWMDAGDLAARE